MKNGVEILKKKFKHLPFAKKNASWLTFLHKPCKFKHNQSSGTREILGVARDLAKKGLPAKTT